LRLWHETEHGLRRGLDLATLSPGVDTWAVDYGLLDDRGRLLGNPVHYRDARHDDALAHLLDRVPADELFAATGTQFLPFNTAAQLEAQRHAGDGELEHAHTLLTIPDLLHLWLGGRVAAEATNASTSQLLDPRTRDWHDGLIARLGWPRRWFPDIVEAGTPLGEWEGTPIVASATHDTASAVAGTPLAGPDEAYLSCGTWSLLGLETTTPHLHAAARAANVTNELGAYGTVRLLKNVMGLWVLQRCRAVWHAQGRSYDYDDLVGLAAGAPPLRSVIPIDDPRLLPPGDHPERVRELCRERGEPVPDTDAQVARCVLESLALGHRHALHAIERVSGVRARAIRMVGGGAQNRALASFTADACALPVLAGPVEATVLGNAAVQAVAVGLVDDLADARRRIAAGADIRRYEPDARHAAAWDAAATRAS
jgi:rhamnulokinase